MNVGRSTRIALAKIDKKTGWLARQLNKSTPSVSMMLGRKYAKCETIEKLAGIFGMTCSEFIKEGE